MNLCEELTMKSDAVERSRKEVREEIKQDFKTYIENGWLEEYIRSKTDENVINKRKMTFGVAYQPFDSFNCASFRCGGYVWSPPGVDKYNSNTYKGVRLSEIEEDVCFYLCEQLRTGLSDLGFNNIHSSGAKANPHYYNTMIVEW